MGAQILLLIWRASFLAVLLEGCPHGLGLLQRTIEGWLAGLSAGRPGVRTMVDGGGPSELPWLLVHLLTFTSLRSTVLRRLVPDHVTLAFAGLLLDILIKFLNRLCHDCVFALKGSLVADALALLARPEGNLDPRPTLPKIGANFRKAGLILASTSRPLSSISTRL